MNSSIEMDDSPQAVKEAPFVPWTLADLGIAIAVLLVFRCVSSVDPKAVAWIPTWILVFAGLVVPQIFFWGYPRFVAGRRGVPDAFRIPAPNPENPLTEVWIAMGVNFGLVAAIVSVTWIISRMSPGTMLPSDVLQRVADSPPLEFVILFVGVATLIAPYCEEVFFRGFLQSALRSRMPFVFAALVQSSIFGALHTFGRVHGILVFILGFVFTLLYEWRKTLLTPILVHAGNNGLASLGFIYMVILNANSPALGVFGHDHPQGCQIDEVELTGAAAKAGIAAGDIITKLDEEPVTAFPRLVTAVRRHRVGDVVTVEILRNGESFDIKVVLEKRPASR